MKFNIPAEISFYFYNICYFHNIFADNQTQQKFLASVQKLNKHKFRTISWEVNGCYLYNAKANRDWDLAEIVWMKVPDPYNVSEKCKM